MTFQILLRRDDRPTPSPAMTKSEPRRTLAVRDVETWFSSSSPTSMTRVGRGEIYLGQEWVSEHVFSQREAVSKIPSELDSLLRGLLVKMDAKGSSR